MSAHSSNPSTLVVLMTILLALLLTASLPAQVQTEVYDSPGTHSFTVPAGVTQITVEAWGGGGKGGDTAGNREAGGGGGAGAYVRGVVSVISGETFSITVGAGGTNNVTNGEDSVFGTNLIRAGGGANVLENETAGGNGGTGSVDSSRVTEEVVQGGQSGFTGDPGNNGGGGNGGSAADGLSSAGGVGGNGGIDADGAPGQAPGAGGGGGHNAPGNSGGGANAPRSGGNGAVGRLIITYAPAQELIVGDCGAAAGFSTINEAVNAAGAGDTILICPGTYDERITVNKDRLTFDSTTQNRDDVIIFNSNTVFSLVKPEASIRNLTIRSGNRGVTSNWPGHSPRSFENLIIESESTGIYIDRVRSAFEPVSLTNISVTSTSGDGINFGPNARGAFELSGIEVSAPSGDGIMIHRGFQLLDDFQVEAGGRGVVIEGGESSGPSAHIIRNGKITGAQTGVDLTANLPMTVNNLVITGSGSGRGIYVNRSRGIEIRDNCISAVQDGIATHREGRDVLIEANGFFDYSRFGVDIDTFQNSRVDVTGNAFLSTQSPRARSDSPNHRFNGNYWEDAVLNPAGDYVDGNIRDRNPLATPPALVCEIPDPAPLIAEYRLEACEWTGANSEVIDSAGNGLNGTVVNNDVVSIRGGIINRAARFNDTDTDQASIEIPDPDNLLDNTGQITIMGWINPATYDPINNNALGIFSKRFSSNNEYAYGMFMGYTGQGCNREKLCIDVNGSGQRFSSNSTVPLNQWTHFTLIIEPGEARLYLNGSLDTIEQDRDILIRDSSAPLRLGDLPEGGTRKPFQGDLDEFKFFGGALNETRVAEIYANEAAGLDWEGNARPPVQCGLVFEARMEQDSWDGTAGEVLDTSGSDFHATAVGDAATAVAGPAIPGSPGTCRYGILDGRGDGIVESSAAAYLNGLQAITAMAWVYNEAELNGNDRGIFFTADPRGGRDNRLGIRYDHDGAFGNGDNVLKASISTSECRANQECHQVETVSNVMVLNQWQHVAMTWESGGSLRVFIDGNEVGLSEVRPADGIGGTIDNVERLDIGLGSKNDRWLGRIDEFRIFDQALDASQIQVWMNDGIPCDLGYDHIRLTHPQTALTCSSAEVSVQACADEDCADVYQGPTTIDFVSPASTWVPDPVTFDGSTQVSLQYTSAEAGVLLNAQAVDPAASNLTRCFTGAVETDCTMEFLESGFVLDVPDHIAADQVTGSIAAVKSDPADPQQCVPGFDNETKDIGFWSTHLNPVSGTLPVGIGGISIDTASPGTPISIDFNGDGVGSFTLAYPDVGEMGLFARYEGSGDEAGLIMLGETSFIARPSHFSLDIADNPAASGPGGNVFRAAGVDFPVEVSVRNADGAITPNFGREATPETVSLSHNLVDPVSGEEGTLSGSFNGFGLACDGVSAGGIACGNFNWSEVGIISLNPRLESGSYLGSGDVVGNASGNVGRFIPDHFVLSDGELINRAKLAGCTSDFTYIGERFDARFTLTAQAFGGGTTMNYEGAFAFLDSGELNLTGNPAPGVTAPSIAWIMGSASATAQLALARTVPEGPFRDYAVTVSPVDDDEVALQTAPRGIGTTDLFFGRMVVDSAIGSELGPLELPWRVEHWENGTWLTHTSDNCTAVDLGGQITLENDTATGVAGTEIIAVAAGGGTTSINPGISETELVSGTGHFHFTAPLSPGWVDMLLELEPDWHFLQPDLDDDGAFDNDPSARASFGLFEGSPNRIFLREVMPR